MCAGTALARVGDSGEGRGSQRSAPRDDGVPWAGRGQGLQGGSAANGYRATFLPRQENPRAQLWKVLEERLQGHPGRYTWKHVFGRVLNRDARANAVPIRGRPRWGGLSVVSSEAGPPLTHLVRARGHEHSGHSGWMGPFRGSAAGPPPSKPSFLDLQPADERGLRSALVGPHSPGVGCGKRPAAWGWADFPGTPSVTEGGGRAPRSGCGLAAPTCPARAGFHSSRASRQHDLPPKSSFVMGMPRGLPVWSLG